MRTLLILLVFFYGTLIFAQEPGGGISYGNFTENETYYLFGDNVNVRSAANIKATVVTKLPIGHPVKILKNTEVTFEVKGIIAHWYQVEFELGGKTQSGYIWGGFISICCEHPSSDKSEMLLFGLSEKRNESLYTQVKLIKSGKLLSSCEFRPKDFPINEGVYNYSVTSDLTDNKGFSGISKFLILHFVYEACGYPNGDIYFSYFGDEVEYAFENSIVSEAGVFHYEEEIKFPQDKDGIKNKVVIVSKSAEWDENTSDYGKPTIEKKIFDFNGRTFLKE